MNRQISHSTDETKKQRRLSRKISQVQLIREPPDGEYGWLVLLGAVVAVSNFTAMNRCYSVFYNYLIDEFQTDFKSVAWTNALISAGYGMSCPLMPPIVKKFGYRPCTIAGGLIGAISILIASQAKVLWQVQLFVAFIPGFCMGPVMISSYAVVTRHFKNRRNLATQIMCGGGSLAALVYSPLYQYLIDQYSWRGALMILAGIFLHITVAGSLMRPIVLEEDFKEEFLAKYRARAQEDLQNNNVPASKKTYMLEEKEKVDGQYDFKYDNEDENSIPLSEDSSDFAGSDTTKDMSLMDNIKKTCVSLQLYVVLEPQLYLYMAAWITFAASYYASLIYLVSYGTEEMGLDNMQATTLISAVMCGEIVARIYYSFIFDRCTPGKRLLIVGVLLLALAVAFGCFLFARGYILLLVFSGLIGSTCGGLDGMFSIFIVDLFGMKHYGAVFGYGNIPIHLSNMMITTAMGAMIDRTHDVSNVFIVAIVSAVLSSAFVLCMRSIYLRKGPFVPSKSCA